MPRPAPRPRPGRSSPQGAAPRVPVLAGVARRAPAPRPAPAAGWRRTSSAWSGSSWPWRCCRRSYQCICISAMYLASGLPRPGYQALPHPGAWGQILGQHSPNIGRSPNTSKTTYFFWQPLENQKTQSYTVKCMFLLCSESPKCKKHTFYTVKCMCFNFWNEISRFQN